MKRNRVLISRIVQFLVTLLGVTFVTFALMYLAPGDPASSILKTHEVVVSQETIDATRARLGLDKPFLLQYALWLGHLCIGDLGKSFLSQRPVISELTKALPGTLVVASLAMVFTIVLSISLGVICALKKDTWIDKVLRGVSFVGLSTPNFWLGLMLLYLFGVRLNWIPIGTAEVSFPGALAPALTLAIGMSSKYMRQVRLTMIDESSQNYVVGAQARGIPHWKIVMFHILPNTLLPLITLFGLAFGWLLGGVVIVEVVFAWPGLGNLLIHAIFERDYPLVQGVVLWVTTTYMIVNLVVDISYQYIDPRLKRGES